MPYYYIQCNAPGCSDKLYIGEKAPNAQDLWTCKGGHKVYVSPRTGTRCSRAGCGGQLSYSLESDEIATCPSCKKTIYGCATFEAACGACGKLKEVPNRPTGQQFYPCTCGAKLNAAANWQAVAKGSSVTFPKGTLTTRDTEYDALEKAGLKLLEGGRFKQSERIARLANGRGLQAGICEGQCLHWIRRVLQGGRPDYDTTHDKLNIARTLAAGDARLVKQSNAAGEIQRLVKAEGQRYGNWDDFARKADQSLSAVKGKPVGGVRRRFTNIKVTKRQSDTQWPSIEQFLNAVFRDSALSNPSVAAAVLGLGVSGTGEDGSTSISGHAIAVFCDKSRALYRLFDPNYGIFSAGSADALQRGALALIKQVWTTYGANPWRLTLECNYSVFETVVQEVRPPDTATAAVHEALVLATQGSLAIKRSPPPPSVEGTPQPKVLSNPGPAQIKPSIKKSPSPAPSPAAQPTSQSPPQGADTGVRNLKSFWETRK